ncbi:hypothetical protein [Nonomuraea sp. LPB2021202275-12-8]|uniref:hypothetical protein n=1 Tax=Nonomuraea sp. LPB2021202275-12-8 TaxID=3120159 RepID=UPI00300CB4D2
MKTLLGAVAFAAVAALAGCGVAAGGSAPAQGGMDADKAVKYVKCMTDHGVPLKLDNDGVGDDGLSIQGKKPDPSKLEAAEKACVEFIPFPPGPKEGTEEWDRLLKFAQCLRQNGLQVQDPKPGDRGIRMPGDEQKVDAALEACEQHAPKPPRK